MRKIKDSHRALFLALQADAKEYPGGIRALAEMLGVNGNTLSNGLNPDHESLPPSFSLIVQIINVTQSKRSVFYLARLVGQIPLDIEINNDVTEKNAVQKFLSLSAVASKSITYGSESAMDGNFNSTERKNLEPLLLDLMKSTTELLQAIRGNQL